MASDLISTANDNSYTNGPVNWLIGSYVSTGPSTGQDTFDAETASVADTFLGITYVNCLLCHNGAGHLTQINLWGSNITRYQALATLFVHVAHGAAHAHSGERQQYQYLLLVSAGQYQGLHHGLCAEHHQRQPSAARRARRVQIRPALLVRAAAVHLQRRFPPVRSNLPRLIGYGSHRRFPVCPRRGELPLGVFLRHGYRGSAGYVRPGAPRPEQSAARSVDSAAHQRQRC